MSHSIACSALGWDIVYAYMKKKIKIISTIGTKDCTTEQVQAWEQAGTDIFRINASHIKLGDLASILAIIKTNVQNAEVMLDLPGPEQRIFGYEDSIDVKTMDTLQIFYAEATIAAGRFYITHAIPISDVIIGKRVFFLNGELYAEVMEQTEHFFKIRFLTKGKLRPNAHINIQDYRFTTHYLSPEEKEMIRIGIEKRVDYLALSMPDSVLDVISVRDFVLSIDPKSQIKLVSKFETKESLTNSPEIINASDAIFVARGDLGQAIDPESLPYIQKQIIKQCNQIAKPVFVATQILSTMVAATIPLRAEVSDLANMIYDGCNGITLSEETAIGIHPILCIQTAKRVIEKTQNPIKDELFCNSGIWDSMSENPLIQKVLAQLKDIGTRVWDRGWAEANAGNVSIDITSELESQALLAKDERAYLVSRTGSRYRNFASSILESICLVVVSPTGERVFPEGAKPTSEWITHKSIQRQFVADAAPHKVILHTHPSDVIAISHLPEYELDLKDKLFSSLPELSIYMPEGIAISSYAAPGSDDLALRSLAVLQNKKALIWQYHGLLCFAPTIDMAYDYLEIVNKAAGIYLKLR